MNRQKILFLALPVLLLAWIALWRMTKTSGGASHLPAAAIVQRTPGATKAIAKEEPSSTETPLKKEVSARDPFRISDKAKEILQQQEEERLRKEREAEEAARTALEAQTPQPEVAVPTALPNLSLQGIVLGEEPKAIINRKILKVGDTIEGAKVTRIEKNGVTVEFQGQAFPLTAATPERKSRPEAPSGPGYPPPYGGSREGYGPGK